MMETSEAPESQFSAHCRAKLSTVGYIYMEWRMSERGSDFRNSLGVSDFHKRSFVWQIVLLGLLGMSGLGIPQIIPPGHTRPV